MPVSARPLRARAPIPAGQPDEPPVVHYVPTRCLARDALDAFHRLGLTPVEEMTEDQVMESSIPRLRAYIHVYQAKITSKRAPKVRAEYDTFFRIWFRYMYDKGHKHHRLALPVYVPPTHPSSSKPPVPQPSAPHIAFTPQSDPGYLKLRPLNPTFRSQITGPAQRQSAAAPRRSLDALFEAAETDAEGNDHGAAPLRMDAQIATLLRGYGLFGRAWDSAGDGTVLHACDYLSTWGARLERHRAATEPAAALCENLADVALQPVLRLGPHVEVDTALAVLRQVPVLSGGMCNRLMRDDRSGVRLG